MTLPPLLSHNTCPTHQRPRSYQIALRIESQSACHIYRPEDTVKLTGHSAMRSSSAEAALLSTLLFPLLVSAVGNIDCSQILLEGVEFDLSELGGARSVLHSVVNTIGDATTYTNTTYMMDVCRPLKKTKFNKCPNGTRGTLPLSVQRQPRIVPRGANLTQYAASLILSNQQKTKTRRSRLSHLLETMRPMEVAA